MFKKRSPLLGDWRFNEKRLYLRKYFFTMRGGLMRRDYVQETPPLLADLRFNEERLCLKNLVRHWGQKGKSFVRKCKHPKDPQA
jgi:hypothetical protein